MASENAIRQIAIKNINGTRDVRPIGVEGDEVVGAVGLANRDGSGNVITSTYAAALTSSGSGGSVTFNLNNKNGEPVSQLPVGTFTQVTAGFVPAPGGSTGRFLKDDGSWDVSAGGVTAVKQGIGINVNGTSDVTVSLAPLATTSASAGPTTSGTVSSFNVPVITRDEYGRVTSLSETMVTPTGTTYGGATSANLGLVKISDNYASSAGGASQNMAASSLAVYSVYQALGAITSVAATPSVNNKSTAIATTQFVDNYWGNKYSFGTNDLQEGVSSLDSGKIYFVYE